jgi:hemolysin activation/secretion protein
VHQYGRAHADWQGHLSTIERDWRLTSRLRAGVLLGDAPVQHFYLLGGRGTVPGHPFRSFVGDRSALLELELRRELADPWISARASAAAGWTSLTDERFDDIDAAGFVGPSIGLGVGFVNEILWLDVHRGFGDDGDWEVLLSVDPRLWDVL